MIVIEVWDQLFAASRKSRPCGSLSFLIIDINQICVCVFLVNLPN